MNLGLASTYKTAVFINHSADYSSTHNRTSIRLEIGQ
jgi:hypothetical protein